jgi:hypothetical protein
MKGGRPDAVVLSSRALNRATLARQLLLSREPAGVVAALERLVALQAQLPRPPFIGLWTRLAGFRREDLLRAIQARQVVRVPAMRATLHLMTAPDYVSLRGAIQPGLDRAAESIAGKRSQAIDPAAVDAAARAFFHASPATFDALRAHLKKTFPGADERALAYNVRLRIPLVQVPGDERWGFAAACDFGLAEDWLGRTVPRSGAMETLVRRYLAAFGPATPADAQTWSGVPRLAGVFEKLRSRLATFRDARTRELFDLPDAPRPSEDTTAPVRFLPEYDNLLLSHHDRTRTVPDEYRSRLITRNLQIPAVFLVDGLVAGTWTIERTRKNATLVVQPFARLSSATRAALDTEGEALLGFAEDGLQTDMRYEKVAK